MLRSLARRLRNTLFPPPPPPPPVAPPPPRAPFNWTTGTDLSHALFIQQGQSPEQFLTHTVPVIGRTLFYDISDLMIFIGAHGFISPIQQGQVDLIETALGGIGVSADIGTRISPANAAL
jgi:hypothetical protein